ncbi:MAG: UDP-N-acetylmuramoyl-L-alanyl-D-glutamate--2,6-diaminopimelate ligase [Halobacteriovorax sp.]|nr:UDP-N-acetylmuramoyl-L-alanyl-D-glutamate--2,6-diaminopimelate ligase [Halobacteriovorax sp.]|tara:strand:+ start:401920 stop:403335 length:1416 start_codon:yes stop_codon:yes gene_type:complete
MNKAQLLNQLEKSDSEYLNFENDFKFQDLTTNLQNSNDKIAAVYNFSDEASEALFKERLSKVSPVLLFLNKKPSFNIKCPTVVIDFKKENIILESILNSLYPINASTPKVLGVTGTNGKSTCVCLCEQLLLQQGIPSGSLGTVGVTANGEILDLGITGTTPSYIDLRRILSSLSSKIKFLFMEVSSHAIDQKRLGSIKLSGAGWTSFSQDHLDYHGTMEEYFRAKAEIVDLFISSDTKLVVPPAQEKLYQEIKDFLNGSGRDSNLLKARELSEFSVGELPPFFKVHYNKDNLALSLELVSEWIDFKKVKLDTLSTPKGRFSVLPVKGAFAIVDYAHTPDAIENLVEATVKAFPDSRVITLFGCGGDRDKTKRPKMAMAAEKSSTEVIVTSDNPRSEEPENIINDIVAGLKKKPLLVEVDREKAIKEGVKNLQDGDVLLIAGKGHEEYQEIKGEKVFFSDFAVVDSIREEND